MQTVFKRTPTLKDCPTHYCPGCGHGIAHRLVCEVIDELGIQSRTIGIAPVGCAVLAYDYFDVDMVEVAHGRAPAVATGMKRTNPDKIVFYFGSDNFCIGRIGSGFNRNFFNLSPDDFGRKKTATFVIKKKVNVEDSKEFYIMTDITKTNAPAVADMKLCHEGTGVLVHDNYTRINIVPRKTAQKQALAA